VEPACPFLGKTLGKEEQCMKNKELPEVLKNLRSAKGLSLRQVEKKTGVSNAYLSQLENGKIKEPSPHILHKLAEIYDTSYNNLMKLAGYIEKREGENVSKKIMSDVAFKALSELDDDEKEAVLEYIEFIRNKRKKK
jgi:transcriptional regulator with XRE-family HTH domain